MLLDLIATAILAGLMLVPLVNAVTAAVIGGTLFGPLGAAGGVAVAISVTALEIWIADLFGWRDLRAPESEAVAIAEAAALDEARADDILGIAGAAAAALVDRVVTGPPTQRRSQMHARETTHGRARRSSATAARRSATR
jgi:hypothetical protein